MADLSGCVALVAGATRGAGRGIAIALGEAGATVVCTGRSVAGQPPVSGHYAGRPETIEETAARVTAAGGRGVAVRVDHAQPEAVDALGVRMSRDHGRLDLLVMDFWGDESAVPFGTAFWDIPLERGRDTIERTLWPHVLTLQRLVPLLRAGSGRPPARPRLIVEVTDGPTLDYRASLFFDLAATLRARLVYALAEELAAEGLAVVGVTPGYLRTELLLDRYGVDELTWRDAAGRAPDLLKTESPALVGRGVAALAADADVARWSGGVFGSWVLAEEYQLTDVDGSRPDFGRHLGSILGDGPRGTGARWCATHATPTRYATRKGVGDARSQ